MSDKFQLELFVFVRIKQEYIIDNLRSIFTTNFLTISNLVFLFLNREIIGLSNK